MAPFPTLGGTGFQTDLFNPFTKINHKDAYSAISPTLPALSATGKIVLITGAYQPRYHYPQRRLSSPLRPALALELEDITTSFAVNVFGNIVSVRAYLVPLPQPVSEAEQNANILDGEMKQEKQRTIINITTSGT